MSTDPVEIVRALTGKWDRGDVEEVLAGYTDDVDYFEVGGRRCRGRNELRRYLERYFATWDNRWHITRIHRLADTPGVVAFWDIEARKRGADRADTVSGMDLLMLRGELVELDWAYFDSAQLR
jgi:ketosteroid isomerase-like protein